MKNRNCPNKDMCWDYDASNCEGCAIGQKIEKFARKIKRLQAENAELKARLDKTVKFPCEITGNLSFTKTKGKKFTYMYEVAKQKIQTTLCIENDHFEIINDDVCFYFNRDDNHEAELKGGRE